MSKKVSDPPITSRRDSHEHGNLEAELTNLNLNDNNSDIENDPAIGDTTSAENTTAEEDDGEDEASSPRSCSNTSNDLEDDKEDQEEEEDTFDYGANNGEQILKTNVGELAIVNNEDEPSAPTRNLHESSTRDNETDAHTDELPTASTQQQASGSSSNDNGSASASAAAVAEASPPLPGYLHHIIVDQGLFVEIALRMLHQAFETSVRCWVTAWLATGRYYQALQRIMTTVAEHADIPLPHDFLTPLSNQTAAAQRRIYQSPTQLG